MRTSEQMYKDIRAWEMDAGESFLDYFDGSLNEANLLFWAMGKGYIGEEGFKVYEEEDVVSGDDIVYGCYPYSIVKEGENGWKEEEYEKAMRILAEFLASSKTYQIRVDEFLSRIDKIKLDDVIRDLWHGERVFFKHEDKKIYVNSPDDVINAPLGKLLSTQWYRDNNELGDEE
jgi:hypothetical protein